jgi:hypothetical protein
MENNVDSILARLEQLEEAITYSDPPPPGVPPFRYVVGHSPVLLSAPHGAAHRRDGRVKHEDEYTAALARLLAERTGASVLYTWARLDDDPNWDRHSPYKEQLRQLVAAQNIRFVLDIHGMSNRHKFGVAVGTICGASCPQRHEMLIFDTLVAEGFRPASAAEAREFPALEQDRFVANHRRFTGGMTNYTVTRFAAEELGVHAAQFEICAGLRIVRRRNTDKWPGDFRGDPAGIVKIVAALERLVRLLGNHEV